MNARRITTALLAAGAVSATVLIGTPQAEAVRYGKVTPQASSNARITHYGNSVSTIQVAPCNRSKSSCSITAVLSPGEVGPAGSYFMYIQSGYQGLRIGAPKGTVPTAGGKWVDGRAYGGLSATYKLRKK